MHRTFFLKYLLKPKSVSFFEKKVNLTTTRINFGSSPRTFLEVSRIHVWDPTHKLSSQQYTYMYFTCFCLIDMFMRKEVSKLEAKDSTMGQDFFWGCISITCLLYWYRVSHFEVSHSKWLWGVEGLMIFLNYGA